MFTLSSKEVKLDRVRASTKIKLINKLTGKSMFFAEKSSITKNDEMDGEEYEYEVAYWYKSECGNYSLVIKL